MNRGPRWSRRELLLATALAPLWACGDRRRLSSEDEGLRIASQTVLSDEVLWALGSAVHPHVIAVSSMADDIRYSRVAGRWPLALPRAAGTSETLLALAPTLVILASFTAAETRQLIESAGLQTLVLEHFDGFEDYRGNVRAIAKAVHAPSAGERLVAEFDTRLATLETDNPKGPLVVSWNEGSVPGEGTSFHDIAIAAGYRNLPAERGRQGHLQIPIEQLVAWDPDVLVVPCGKDDCEKVVHELAARPGLRATRAAREGHVIGIPSRDLYSTGGGMLDVVQRLRAARPGANP